MSALNTPLNTAHWKKHDHRRSIWIIGCGTVLWCYRCGAIRSNEAGRQYKWRWPTGPKGKNPA